MAKYDHGGGCACGLYRVCECQLNKQSNGTVAGPDKKEKSVMSVLPPRILCGACGTYYRHWERHACVAASEDAISHPTHYARWKMEPVEFIAINDLPWWLANIIKYTMRFDAKDGLKDLYKARSYLEMKIRQLEGAKRFWDKPVTEERKLNDVPKNAT